jgi:hypothetical protein
VPSAGVGTYNLPKPNGSEMFGVPVSTRKLR